MSVWIRKPGTLKFALAVSASVLALALVGRAQAASETPYSATVSNLIQLEAGKRWFAGDIFQARDVIRQNLWTGEIGGVPTIGVETYSLNVAGSRIWGTTKLVTATNTWEGSYEGYFVGPFSAGTSVLRSAEDGTILRGWFGSGARGGVLLDPHG